MTARAFLESIHGCKTELLSKDAIVKLMEDFNTHYLDEIKKTKSVFNTERWVSETSFIEENRKRLNDKK